MPVWCFPSCAAPGGGSASDAGFSSTRSLGRCCPTGSTSSGRPATTATRSRSTCTSCSSRRATTCRCRREIAARLEDMVDVLLALREPDGSMPAIGDADGGSLLPLAPRPRGDLRGVFAVAAAVFRRPDYAWAAEGPGARGAVALRLRAFRLSSGRRPPAPETAASALFAEGGYAVMRSGWDRRAHQLVFDTGPLGCPVSAGHGHADLLGIQCTVFGEPTHRGSGHLLLHGGAGMARLLPRHRGPLDRESRRPRPGGPARALLVAGAADRAARALGHHGRRSTSPTPSTTPTRGSPTP